MLKVGWHRRLLHPHTVVNRCVDMLDLVREVLDAAATAAADHRFDTALERIDAAIAALRNDTRQPPAPLPPR